MSRRRVSSLGLRLSMWLALQSLAGLSVVCTAVYAVAHLGFASRQTESLAQKQVQVRHLLAEPASRDDPAVLIHKLDDFFVGHQELRLSLQRPDGSLFYQRAGSDVAPRKLRRVRFEVAASVSAPGSLAATLSLDTSDDDQLLRQLALTLLAAALTGAALGSAGGFVLVRLGLRPVRALVEQTRRLAADTLHRRLDGSGQAEELEPLVAQFNALLGRLSLAYEQLEGFNADVAHELCTPLATLIGSTELALRKARGADALREVLGANLEELQRLAGIVQDMLFLSQADRGSAARRVHTASLAALARQVVEYHDAALDEAGLQVEVTGDAAGAFDLPLLQRALSNLVANATRHADRGTTVRIDIDDLHRGGLRLVVVNQGASIAPGHLPRLFDRFFRGDQARSGAHQNHGLGLSIVAAIAHMHGGQPFASSAGGVTSIGFTLLREPGAGGPPPSPVGRPP